jgi:UDP-GlcNAc:undecaprenyl-phosphate GlcNAc-1-phosphate transferase
LALVAGLAGDTEHLLPLIGMCGCLVGFLFFNLRTPWRSKAVVFLGDAGSSYLGFVLAWFLIDMSQGDSVVIKPVSVLWFAVLLIYSTVEIVSRRVLRRRSPFKPDNEHLHHVFILAGFSVSEAVATLAVITLIGVIVGIAATLLQFPDNILFATFVLFGLLFLRVIFRTWEVMRFLQRSICRRRGERRERSADRAWEGVERRKGEDRRKPGVGASE